MLQKFDFKDLDILDRKMLEQFPETWNIDEKACLQDENMYVFTNNNNTYFAILRLEEDFLHWDWAYLDKELRGKGYGTSAAKEIVETIVPSLNCNKDIRYTVRATNIASYKMGIKNGFKCYSNYLVGSEIGYEMIYTYPKEIDVTKYHSSLPSSCGLTVLSALHDLKYNNYINPDDLKISCIKNRGIPQNEMLAYCVSNFGLDNIKVLSNKFGMSSEIALHQLEQYLQGYNHFALVDIGTDGYEHWILITNLIDDNTIEWIDSEHDTVQYTQKWTIYMQMHLCNLFSILI